MARATKVHAVKVTETFTAYEYIDGSAMTACGRWIDADDAATTTKDITCMRCWRSNNIQTHRDTLRGGIRLVRRNSESGEYDIYQ